ncbi:MAG: hypothetical protein EZS28_023933, partial [Streblomastix strix]
MSYSPDGNVPSFVLHSKLAQVISLWMCNAGGEEQNDTKIAETMNKLYYYIEIYFSIHGFNEKDRFEDLSKMKKNNQKTKRQFDESMLEEGFKEELEAHIFSHKSHIKLKSLQLKTELMGFK